MILLPIFTDNNGMPLAVMIIERTVGLVFGPTTALCRFLLKHCTATIRTIGTLGQDQSRSPRRRQDSDSHSL